MQRWRRIGAYGLCRDGDRVLLVRAAPLADFPGVWQLPGGTLRHGEHPAAAVMRKVAQETGLRVAAVGPRAVVADVLTLPAAALHTDRIVFDVRLRGGCLRAPTGMIDEIAWVPAHELPGLPMMPFTADLLGVPVTALSEPVTSLREPPRPRPDRGQRFAAYGLVTDRAGRVLLSLIAPGYPGAGRWHLPGGGTDHGEQPTAGLLRELIEETGQLGRVTGLVDVSSHRNPSALGPEGRPIDWHAVRAIYRVVVDAPTEAAVTEITGGSTAAARWFDQAATAGLRLTPVAAAALAKLRDEA
ncbi:MAG TPA: NUDIX domain-containing protein [Micromonosporaceae bacterium]